MAISFEESLNAQASASTYSSSSSDTSSSDEVTPTAYSSSSEDESWIRNDTIYEWDDEYVDSNYGSVDENKNITMPTDQFSVTQERNSQYIPFTLNRYYDGVDLTNMVFVVHGQNKNKEEFRDSPINFEYNSTTIRFGWLLSEYACSESGTVNFEIEAYGVNQAGKDYKWITRPNGSLNVVESLCGTGNGTVQPSDDWITQFLSQVTSKVAEAQSAAQTAESAATHATEAATQAQNVVDNAKTELQDSVDETVANSLSNYYTKTEVDDLMADIDLTDVYNAINSIDGLANFKTSYDSDTRVITFYNGDKVISTETLNSNPTSEWIAAYDLKVDGKISDATSSFQSDLDTINTDLESIHSEIDGLPETLATDYYTKTATDELLESKADQSDITSLESSISAVESTANTNKTNIGTLGTKISEIEETISGLNTSQEYTYDTTYDEEYNFTLWEIENEGLEDEVRTAKSSFKIQGGSGSGGTSSTLKIEYITKTPLVVTTNDSAIIKFNFSGTDSSGDDVLEGSATWKIGSTIVATQTVVSGENSFDATDYISLGTQKLTLSVTDDAGSLVTKSWTVQKIDVRIESTFNDQLTYPIGTVSFDYTPYGAISKEVHFILDGVELTSVTTSSSGIPMAYTLPSQEHGSHLLEVYMTAEVNSSIIESNHITKDIIWYDSSSDIPVISCTQQNITAKQYDTTNIVYTVYDPTTESPKVTLAVDGEIVSTLTLDSNTQTWQYKSSDIGDHVLTITCRDTVKTLYVTVEELGIDVEPVTAGLAFDFNPTGRSNNDEDRLWSDGTVSMSVSDNFDWVNGGYQIDDSGDQYFGIKAGTYATIDYKLFADDAKRNGKEFKLIFKTTNVRKSDATFLTCVDGTTSKIGLQMNVHEAYVYGSADSLYLPYSEEDIIEFEININKDTDIPMVMGYEDGVATRPMIYSDSHSFTQTNPQIIKIGSDNCDVFVYRMKVYSSSLTDTGILSNFIADARNADEMIDRYTRNQIYDENNLLTPESLAKACPSLKVIKLECPHFTNDKKDFVKNTNIECIHTGGDPVLDNWTAKNCYHSGRIPCPLCMETCT